MTSSELTSLTGGFQSGKMESGGTGMSDGCSAEHWRVKPRKGAPRMPCWQGFARLYLLPRCLSKLSFCSGDLER